MYLFIVLSVLGMACGGNKTAGGEGGEGQSVQQPQTILKTYDGVDTTGVPWAEATQVYAKFDEISQEGQIAFVAQLEEKYGIKWPAPAKRLIPEFEKIAPATVDSVAVSHLGVNSVYDSLGNILAAMRQLNQNYPDTFSTMGQFGLQIIPYKLDASLSQQSFEHYKKENSKDYQVSLNASGMSQVDFDAYFRDAHFLGKGSFALRLTYGNRLIEHDSYTLDIDGQQVKIPTSFNYGKLCPPGCDLLRVGNPPYRKP